MSADNPSHPRARLLAALSPRRREPVPASRLNLPRYFTHPPATLGEVVACETDHEDEDHDGVLGWVQRQVRHRHCHFVARAGAASYEFRGTYDRLTRSQVLHFSEAAYLLEKDRTVGFYSDADQLLFSLDGGLAVVAEEAYSRFWLEQQQQALAADPAHRIEFRAVHTSKRLRFGPDHLELLEGDAVELWRYADVAVCRIEARLYGAVLCLQHRSRQCQGSVSSASGEFQTHLDVLGNPRACVILLVQRVDRVRPPDELELRIALPAWYPILLTDHEAIPDTAPPAVSSAATSRRRPELPSYELPDDLDVSFPAPSCELLGCGGRSIADWRTAVSSLLRSEALYREAAVAPSTALAVLRDRRCQVDQRIGAALALQATGHPDGPALLDQVVLDLREDEQLRAALAAVTRDELTQALLQKATEAQAQQLAVQAAARAAVQSREQSERVSREARQRAMEPPPPQLLAELNVEGGPITLHRHEWCRLVVERTGAHPWRSVVTLFPDTGYLQVAQATLCKAGDLVVIDVGAAPRHAPAPAAPDSPATVVLDGTGRLFWDQGRRVGDPERVPFGWLMVLHRPLDDTPVEVVLLDDTLRQLSHELLPPFASPKLPVERTLSLRRRASRFYLECRSDTAGPRELTITCQPLRVTSLERWQSVTGAPTLYEPPDEPHVYVLRFDGSYVHVRCFDRALATVHWSDERPLVCHQHDPDSCAVRRVGRELELIVRTRHQKHDAPGDPLCFTFPMDRPQP